MEDKMKNIVVLKNLPSNLVEEAIVILKENNKKVRCVNKKYQKDDKGLNKPKDYMVKEAEMVISNYILDLEKDKPKNKKNRKNLEKKYKRMKIANIIICVALIISLI